MPYHLRLAGPEDLGTVNTVIRTLFQGKHLAGNKARDPRELEQAVINGNFLLLYHLTGTEAALAGFGGIFPRASEEKFWHAPQTDIMFELGCDRLFGVEDAGLLEEQGLPAKEGRRQDLYKFLIASRLALLVNHKDITLQPLVRFMVYASCRTRKTQPEVQFRYSVCGAHQVYDRVAKTMSGGASRLEALGFREQMRHHPDKQHLVWHNVVDQTLSVTERVGQLLQSEKVQNGALTFGPALSQAFSDFSLASELYRRTVFSKQGEFVGQEGLTAQEARYPALEMGAVTQPTR